LGIRLGELNAPNLVKYSKFGASIDISVRNTKDYPNITLAVVGAPGINTAYAYQWLWNTPKRIHGKWYLEAELTHPDASQRDHMFAQTGAVAIDGHWIVIGASGSERVFVWKRQELDVNGKNTFFLTFLTF
jgi:hypothetical protein